MSKNERIYIRISEEDKDNIKTLSDKYDVSMSELILKMIRFLEYIQDKKDVPLGLALDIILQTDEFRYYKMF